MGIRSAFLLGLIALPWMTCAQAWPRVDAQLNAAASAGDIAAIDKALADGANPDQARALAAAVAGDHREAVADLLRHHADPDAWARGTQYALSSPEGSPVFEAAKLGDRQMLLDLVYHGADLNAASHWGYLGDTPLACAVRNGELGAVRLLIEAGADVNRPGANGETPLHNAVLYGESHAVEIVQLLLAHGADPDMKDNRGKSAREISYGYGAPGIRAAIEQAKPPAPFTRPEDVATISEVLLCRAAEGAMTPGYLASTRAAYETWRAPRSAVIKQIESAPEFRRNVTQLLGRVTPAAAAGGELQTQCALILPAELAPAHLSAAAELQRVSMMLICKAIYDVLIPGYATQTQRAYASWRASHRAVLGQIEANAEFREQRAEALRELTPLGSGPGSVQATGATAVAETECANLMPADLRAAVPATSSGAAVPPNGLAVSPGPSGATSDATGTQRSSSAAAGEAEPEVSMPPAAVAAPPAAHPNQASAKVKYKQVIRSAPTPVGGAVSPQKPQ